MGCGEVVHEVPVAAEVLHGQTGDGHAHQGIGQRQVEDEAPALVTLPEEQPQQGGCHQQVDGDDEEGGDSQDYAHHLGPHIHRGPAGAQASRSGGHQGVLMSTQI